MAKINLLGHACNMIITGCSRTENEHHQPAHLMCIDQLSCLVIIMPPDLAWQLCTRPEWAPGPGTICRMKKARGWHPTASDPHQNLCMCISKNTPAPVIFTCDTRMYTYHVTFSETVITSRECASLVLLSARLPSLSSSPTCIVIPQEAKQHGVCKAAGVPYHMTS